MPIKKRHNIPFAPAKFPFFYGWIVLVVGTIGVSLSIPGQTTGVSAFTESLMKALDFSRQNLANAYFFGTVISGFIVFFAGKFYDKYGARPSAIVAGSFLALFLLYFSFIDKIFLAVNGSENAQWQNVIKYMLTTIGFFGIRFFGQGLLTLSSRNMVMKWFERNRGFVNIFLGALTIITFNYLTKVLFVMVDEKGWVATYRILAAILGIGFVTLAFVFFRDNPEECGLKPDGNFRVNSKPPKVKLKAARDYELKEAIRTYTFWIFNLTLAINAMYFTAFSFNVEDLFKMAGHSKEVALSIYVPWSVIAVCFVVLGSWMSDRVKLKYLALLQNGGMILSALGLMLLNVSEHFKWLLIAGNGMAWAMFMILTAVSWPRFFGLKNLGAISGFSMSWMVVFSAIGPSLYSYSKQLFGGYYQGIVLCLAIVSVLFVLSFKANNIET